MARKKRALRETGIPSNTLPNVETGDPLSAGQAGDLQGLTEGPDADSESVRELLEEGQAYEAGIVSGVENAPPADEAEVKVRQVKADDVPFEYEQDEDEPKE